MVHYHIKRCGPTLAGPARIAHDRELQTTDINPTVISTKLLIYPRATVLLSVLSTE